MGFVYVPLLPELIEAIEEETGLKDERINDMASGLFHAACQFGSSIGPIIGAILFQYTGFRWTCEILAMVAFFFGIVYFLGTYVFNNKPFKQEKFHVPKPDVEQHIERKDSNINLFPEFGLTITDQRSPIGGFAINS